MNIYANEFVAQKIETRDLKPVIAVVDSVHRSLARSRISGTLDGLSISEGDHVEKGQIIAVVVDPKQPLEIDAIDARLKSLEQERDLAAAENKRYSELVKENLISKSAFDEVNTRLQVLENNYRALTAERSALIEKRGEGKVLAPIAGRILKVPVTNGTVMMAGDTIAEIAMDGFILRLSVPERHTQFLKLGDEIQISRRQTHNIEVQYTVGIIKKLYPKLEEGRVIADIVVEKLDDFFVGELMTAYIKTANKLAFFIPKEYIIERHGLNYVKLKTGHELVVQPGLTTTEGVEILSGLQNQDILVTP